MADEKHWEKVYATKGAERVSWYAPHLSTSLRLIVAVGHPSAAIIDVGGGASTLIDDLVTQRYQALTVLDLSNEALRVAETRLADRARAVRWVHGNILTVPLAQNAYDIWHDRAVFHFLTAPGDRERYVEVVRAAVKPGGHVIVATFGPHGPEQCSGLNVMRYEGDSLHAQFGSSFEKIGSEIEIHRTPWGTEQEFVYCYCLKRGP